MKNENNQFSNKQLDLFMKYLFRPILLQIFAAVKASLVVNYIIVVKNISFTFQKEPPEGRCCEIYSLEEKAKPATRDKNRFIIDVGRALHPSLVLTELSQEFGVLHASVSFPMVYFKDFERMLRTSIICVNYRESFDLG